MSEHPPTMKVDIHSEEFLQSLMRRQLRLSLSCAFAFCVVLFGLPLMNYFQPELMATKVFGFPLSWFILGILFFPLVWVISYVFIQKSISLENQETLAAKSSEGAVEKSE